MVNVKSTPHFIIVGSMKSGTTSLHQWLMKSNEIFMKQKEIHFFDRDDIYSPRLDLYLSALGADESMENKLYVGDDTPTYSYLKKVPERIYRMCPHVKIVWILRDPLARSVSQYWHAARSGVETREINEAFNDEIQGKTNDIWKLYLSRSKYNWQIKNFLEYFDREQMLFVDFKKFISGNEKECLKITRFLGVATIDDLIPHSNEARFFPRPFVSKAVKFLGLPKKVQKTVRLIFGYNKNNKPRLNKETTLLSKKYLQEGTSEIYEMTGLNFFDPKAD